MDPLPSKNSRTHSHPESDAEETMPRILRKIREQSSRLTPLSFFLPLASQSPPPAFRGGLHGAVCGCYEKSPLCSFPSSAAYALPSHDVCASCRRTALRNP